jgi:hypothetical protein
MACPKCGCKLSYQYDPGDDLEQTDERLERCAACRHVFDIEDHTDEDDDDDDVAAGMQEVPRGRSHHQRTARGHRPPRNRRARLHPRRPRPEAVAETCARAAYEAANPQGKRWSYLGPGEWERWRAVANAVRRAASCGVAPTRGDNDGR